jgi:predicted RNA-binding Zn-ribbon protein involved in translation (DUF1610 family)
MALIAAVCSRCGGQIQVDNSLETGICPFCGTTFITEKIVNNYHTNNTFTSNVVINKVGNAPDYDVAVLIANGFAFIKIHEWDKLLKLSLRIQDEFPRASWGYMFQIMAGYRTDFGSTNSSFSRATISPTFQASAASKVPSTSIVAYLAGIVGRVNTCQVSQKCFLYYSIRQIYARLGYPIVAINIGLPNMNINFIDPAIHPILVNTPIKAPEPSQPLDVVPLDLLLKKAAVFLETPDEHEMFNSITDYQKRLGGATENVVKKLSSYETEVVTSTSELFRMTPINNQKLVLDFKNYHKMKTPAILWSLLAILCTVFTISSATTNTIVSPWGVLAILGLFSSGLFALISIGRLIHYASLIKVGEDKANQIITYALLNFTDKNKNT